MSTLTFPLVPDYYVNYATGNDGTGDGSLATPWKTIAKFVATAAAGSVCGMMADETISATITLTGKPGTSAADPYGLVSVDSSGNEDGLTKYVDGNNAVAVGFTCGGNNLWWVFRGIFVKRCTSQAWLGAYHNSFYRCGSENVAGQGWQSPSSSIFEACWATGAAYGFNLSLGNTLHACIAIACSTAGFNCGSAKDGAMTDCVAHACGVGFAVSSTVRGGVADGCTTGINIGPNHYAMSIVGVQITNNTTGINGGGVAVCTGIISACQWYNNGAKIGANAHIDDDGTSVDLGANPYKDLAGHDFRTPATLANAAGILVDMYNSNEVRIFPGLPRTLAAVLPAAAKVNPDQGQIGFLDALITAAQDLPDRATGVVTTDTLEGVAGGVDVAALIAAAQAANNTVPTHGEDSLVLGDSCKVGGTTYDGNRVPELHSPDEVVDNAVVPGNYKVGNLIDENVRSTKEYGIAGIGNLLPGAPWLTRARRFLAGRTQRGIR